MSAFVTPRRPANRRRPVRPSDRRFVVALALQSATLAVFATLHLTGALHIGSASRPSYGAGVAEALICVALLAGAVALARAVPARGRRIALAALGFAIFGFFVGLSFTVGSGDTIDLVYHAVMLPVLMATAALLLVRRDA
jgi:hypothetical protein